MKMIILVHRKLSVNSVMTQKYHPGKSMVLLNLFDLCCTHKTVVHFEELVPSYILIKKKLAHQKKVSTYIGKTRLGSLHFNSF
jgi:hypothetical protein